MPSPRHPAGQRDIRFFAFGFNCRPQQVSVWDCFHRHDEVELGYLASGSITFRFSNHVRTVRQGEAVLFWGSHPHQVIAVTKPAEYRWVAIPLGMFLQWRLPAAITEPVLAGQALIDQRESGIDALLFSQWITDTTGSKQELRETAAMEVCCRLRRFAHASVRAGDRRPPVSVDSGAVERISLHLADHFRERLTLASVAAAVGLHPNYAARLFRQQYGSGIIDYVIRLRVTHSQRLLAVTNDKILDIALESGFETVSNFYNAFKRVTGMTPAAFRRRLL